MRLSICMLGSHVSSPFGEFKPKKDDTDFKPRLRLDGVVDDDFNELDFFFSDRDDVDNVSLAVPSSLSLTV